MGRSSAGVGASWDEFAGRLIDWRLCPRCGARLSGSGICDACGADLTGSLGAEIGEASKRVVEAISVRQALVAQLPSAPERGVDVSASHPAPAAYGALASSFPTPGNLVDAAVASASAPASASATAPGQPSRLPATATATATATASAATATTFLSTTPTTTSGSQISVQSVLAVAGAGLLAVAALVFTFLNPDLTSFAMRTTIIAVITVAFVAGAWFFARRGLQFSAESVGALAAVFAALDVWAFAQGAPDGVNALVFAGIGTVLASALFWFLASRSRIRTWLWAAVVGFALSPGFFGAAGDNPWSPVIGTLVVTIVVLGVHWMLRRLEPGFGLLLGVERTTATVLQIVAVVATLIQLPLLAFGGSFDQQAWLIGSAAVLLSLAAVAAVGSWTGLGRFWSFSAGGFAAAAVGILPFAIALDDSAWYFTLVPLATGLVVVVITALRYEVAASRRALLGGARTVAILSAVPTLLTACLQLLSALRPLGYYSTVPANVGLAVLMGLAALALGSAAEYLILRRAPEVQKDSADLAGRAADRAADRADDRAEDLEDPEDRENREPSNGVASAAGRARTTALWMAVLALLTLTGWGGFDSPVRAVIGLALAGTLSVLLVLWPVLVDASVVVRRPLVIGAHLLLALAALIGWLQDDTIVWVGAAAVVVLGVVSLAMPARLNPLYIGLGYAYALVIFATALVLAGVDGIAVLCLTTTLALLVALCITLTGWLSPRSWYATLLVTAAPFLLGVAAVLMVRSGWTALSTSLAFALALTLMLTRRPGMTLLLRSAAAALLVPSLAVVVVCLGAQLFASSGSPIVLPIIAAIVACTVPATELIAGGLRRRGLPAIEADAARTWIEISAIVTAALAVLLALVRTAAGLGTTFLVLVILGIGAAASAYTTHRPRAWWAAAASWTGALWCVWAIRGVDVLEPYLLPPALTAVIVGAIFVARGRAGGALFASGLAIAVVPSVAVLAFSESAGAGAIPWRAYGLLGAALVLVILGMAVQTKNAPARYQRLRALGWPTNIVATVAAGAGAVQAVRWGRGIDSLAFDSPALLMLQTLTFSALAAVLAAAAGYFIVGTVSAAGLPGLADLPGLSGLSGSGLSASGLPGHGGGARPTSAYGSASGQTLAAGAPPSRWRYAAALAFLVVGPITAIRFDPLSIATLMVLTLALLTFMLVVVAHSRSGATPLPPAWFIFGLAWCTAVAGWSERELRVEAFSLPLGFALLGAGIIAMLQLPERADVDTPSTSSTRIMRGTWTSWPNGFVGSWRVLAPGIIVLFLPSVLATGTDPQTWRAILVMSLALAAILIGSVKRLAAPFVLGLAVLPIEIIVVFTVQIGQTINPLLWWITLAAAGAVLLVIAITSERKGADSGSFTARMRDLG